MGLKDCPTRDALDRWASGDLADDEADAIAEHLDTCADCERTIADFPDAGFLAYATVAAVGPRFDHERECEAFVSALQNLAPHSRSSHSAGLQHDHWVGRRIRDYQLLERLGQGAMGAVYAARHTRLNKKVAIKLLTDKLHGNPAAVTRFQREMRAVGRLEHPNIVQALDAGESDGVSYLVMELVDGIDLARLTSQQRALDVADACEIARQAAVGLQYAHSQGLVHRDVKPSNLMLTRDADGHPRVKILDLGLASIEGLDTYEHLTDDGQLMGTLEFMAPEQAEDTRSVDHRADIYALGATLYRLLTGHVPFDHRSYNTPAQRLLALTQSRAPSIATQRETLPTGLADLIDQMLAREPKDRPLDMEQVATRLGEFSVDQHLDELLEQVQQSRLSTHKLTNESHSPLVDTTPSRDATLSMARREKDQDSTRVPRKTRNKRSRLLLAIFAVPLVAVLAGTIWLQTDGGYIRIETADPSIDVSVKVLRDGESVDTVRVSRERNRFWYRSGQYEIRFPEGVGDSLEISVRRVTLTRGNERVVTISRVTILERQQAARSESPTPALIVVTTTVDGANVPGSIRHAIANALPGGTIRFAPDLAGKTIVLNDTPLYIVESITIDAENLDAAITIDGNGLSRVFELDKRCQLIIQGATITGGKDYAPGGGIFVNEAALTMRSCTISNCSAPTDGGGIYCVNGNVVLEDCLVANNAAGHLGGGIANYGGTCLLKNCVFTKNASGREHGAAILNVNAGKMELIHCTVAGNIDSGVSSHRWSTLILDSSIVADNDHLDDGGNKDVWIQRLDGGGIVARGANVIEKFGADVKSGPAPIIAKAMLAPLGDYGGRFPTMPPLPGSPAIDAATISEFTPVTDIRGIERPLDGIGDGMALPDIGAVEFDSGRDGVVSAVSGTGDKTAAVALPTRDLPDITKLPKGKVRVFGTADQPMEIGAAADIDHFVEVQKNSNIWWFGFGSNGDVMRWHVDQGVTLYREGQDVCVLNRTAGTAYGDWLASDGKIIARSYPDGILMANAPQTQIVDLARSYPSGDWTALTNDGRLHYIGKTEFPPPTEITDFVRLGNWHDHQVGIRENGRLVVWGRDPAQLPDLSGLQFAKIRSTEFYSLLLTAQGTLVHLTKEQIVELPEGLRRNGWIDIACGHIVSAARQADGRWHAWGDPPAAEVVAKINSLGANVPSISMTQHAAVWIETE